MHGDIKTGDPSDTTCHGLRAVIRDGSPPSPLHCAAAGASGTGRTPTLAGHLRCSFVRGMVVTVSQVVALLSSALSGVEVIDCRRWSGRGQQDLDHRPAVEQCCVVCISTCGDGEEVRRLPCGHAFHRDCVDRWLARCRRTCPLCRLHVGGVGLLDDDQHQLSEDLVIWFSSLFVAGL